MIPKIVVTIKKGTVQSVISNTDEIEIVFLDYDNDELNPDKYGPDSLLTDEGIQQYIKKEIAAQKSILISKEAYLQLIESINSAEGRITNGAEIEKGFDWLREELDQINEGVSVNDTSETE